MRRLAIFGAAVLAIGAQACSGPETEAEETFVSPPENSALGQRDVAPAPVGETVGDLSARGEIVLVEEQTGEAGLFTQPCAISRDSIAGIVAPATLGAFAGAFPAGSSLVFEPLYMVDFGSLCLVVSGRERVCTMFYEAEVEAWDPGAEALGLFTRDPACLTADGIGPASSVEDAIGVFGAPEFRFSYDNEGREYVSFAAAPDALGFRMASEHGEALAVGAAGSSTLWPSGAFGGDYRGGEDFVTGVAMPDAVIAEVSVY